ncbi:MAG: T9SS type A sorting domain-containing protein [Bacteroidetes bacterium]|nr:T9SS type A sorting domain-containing protein [Bacteroidota bacterium]
MKKVIYLSICCLLCTTHSFFGQTHIWTGNGGNEDWFLATNWEVNTVPDASSEVLIPSNFIVEITAAEAVASSLSIDAVGMLIVLNDLTVSTEVLIANDAALIFKQGIISGGATIVNNGSFKVNDVMLKGFDNVTIQNNALILVAESNQAQFNSCTINNASTGTIDIASVGGFLQQNNNTVLNNEGLVRKRADGINPIGNFYLIMEINNSGTINVAHDEILLLLAGGSHFTTTSSGRMEGAGTYDITSDVMNEGTVYPGNEGEIGTMHITNNFAIQEGTLEVDILSPSEGEYDAITIVGSPQLDGYINVRLMDHLALGDGFDIVTWNLSQSSCSFPQFTTASYEGLEYRFEVFCESNSVRLEVESITTLGLIDHSKNKLIVSPNPVKNGTTFRVPTEHIIGTTIALYNYLGQEVTTVQVLSENTVFHRGKLPAGIYFARLSSKNIILSTISLVLK